MMLAGDASLVLGGIAFPDYYLLPCEKLHRISSFSSNIFPAMKRNAFNE